MSFACAGREPYLALAVTAAASLSDHGSILSADKASTKGPFFVYLTAQPKSVARFFNHISPRILVRRGRFAHPIDGD